LVCRGDFSREHQLIVITGIFALTVFK